MQLNFLAIILILADILFEAKSSTVAPIIGSGSYFIQAGYAALTPTQITNFQATNATLSKSHNIIFTYSMATYDLSIGLKKVNWHFDNNESIKGISAYSPTKSATQFTLTFRSTFGSSLYDLEISYIAVDISLNSYIYTFTGGTYIAMVASTGTTWPANFTTSASYSRAWPNFKSTTKVLLYCSSYQYNPALSTANHSLGQYIELRQITTTTFNIYVVIPFGMDNDTRFDSKIIYFNPPQLLADKHIILNTFYFTSGDKLTVKTLSNSSFYTYTYAAGDGCDMTDNNTLIVLQPYVAFSSEMIFQLSQLGNTIYAAASNYYAINFSVIHFCSQICATAANPFLYRVDNMCYDVCPDGFYGNSTTTFCELCQLNCSTCSMTQTNCTACVNGTVLSGHTCIEPSGDLVCTGNCLTCNSTSTNCSSCITSTYLLNFDCLATCPLGTYADGINLECVSCATHCLNCSSSSCFNCDGVQFLYSGACQSPCPATTYADSVSKSCLSCTGNCLNCNNTSTNCTSCVSGTFLSNFNCLAGCPLGTYEDIPNAVCVVCAAHCLNCTSSSCFACDGVQFLYNLACHPTCPSTTYADSLFNECLNCTAPCMNCHVISTNCTSCIAGSFFFNFSCLSSCPLGYYGNSSLNLCVGCPIYCLNCSSATQCYQCQNGSFLYNLACVLSCPNTTYGDTSINQCVDCNGTCYNCEYESTNCTSCINNTFFLSFDCYYNCPAGYYGNTSTGNCQTCFLNCSTCTAVNVCTQCIPNRFLSPNFDRCETSCPPNYFPNSVTRACQRIIIQGCISALYFNGVPICLQCDVSQYFKYVPNNKSCVCKDGYKLNNGTCQEYCGDGIVNNMSCDDGNFVNGDGCSFQCLVENNFNCFSVPNGPTLKSKCSYLPEINLQILSETKVDGQNTLKLILKVYPTPISLSSDQIKQFLNMKIDKDVINMSKLQINYKNGIAQIYIPFTKDIQDKELSLWTNFDPTKFSSSNIFFSSKLKGDNVALLYSSDLTLYKVIGTFNFSMAIFVCIFALFSSYKHKMIGLELIMPFQVILYSQSFYDLKTLQTTFYTSFKPVSYSILTPDQAESKNNAWYKIGMTGGFLENYNLLGLIFLISTILLIICMFKLQHGQRNRFKHKKAMRDWLNFGQFKILIRQYQPIIWKYFFISFCLSTIPLIFSVSAKAMTVLPNFYAQTTLNIINDKCNYLFYLLLMGALFYTSIPRIFYNNKKNLLKKHIFKREGEKFKYDASYCMYFQLHYLSIGFIYAYCPPTLPVFYTISGINGLFFLYLVVKRPYESILDNVGAILSNSIVAYFLSINLYIKITGSSGLMMLLSKISGFLITFLLLVQCVVAIVRLIIFWAHDKEQNLNGLTRDQKIDGFKYQKDKAFNKFVKGAVQDQEVQFNNMMNLIQGEMIFNQPRTIHQQLIPTIFQRNTNQNPPNSILDLTQPKVQVQKTSQQKYSSLKRIRNNLRQSLNKYKIQQQQRQTRFNNNNESNTNSNPNTNISPRR